ACLGCTCTVADVSHSTLAHEIAGAASTRHSLLPLFEGKGSCKTSGAMRRENAKMCQMLNAVIASEAKQSILSLCRNVDCFAPLAMTWMGRNVVNPPHARGMTALCVVPR